MINSLFISKTGMEAQQTQLDVISHNLANVSTTGYKRASAVFEDLIYQNLRQSGAQTTEQNQLPTGLHLGLGVRPVATSRQFLQGALPQSNKALDVASDGTGISDITGPVAEVGMMGYGKFDQPGNVHRIKRRIGIGTGYGRCCRARGQCWEIELHRNFRALETTQTLA